MNTIDCEGRTLLITGAGSGLGRDLAIALATAGARVVAAVRRPATGEDVVAAIEREGGWATWVECDVTRRDHVDAAVREAVARTGRLDGAIHNATAASASERRTLEKLDDAFWEEIAATNLRAAFWLARAAYPELKASQGTLILLTSGAGIEGAALMPEYGAAKAAIRALTKSLAAEWGPDGITVNCLSPAAMTESYQRVIENDPQWADHIRTAVPLGRIGDPLRDIGPAMVFLASPASRYMTGQTLVVNGGRTLLL